MQTKAAYDPLFALADDEQTVSRARNGGDTAGFTGRNHQEEEKG